MFHRIALIGTGVVCYGGIMAACLMFSAGATQPVLISEARIETGSPITVDAFFDIAPADSYIVSDISEIDTLVPGTYPLVVSYSGKEEDVTLTVSDTTAPEAVAVPQSIYVGDALPLAEDFVTDVYDLSGCVTADFAEVPDKYTAGCIDVTIKLFDPYGNTSEVVSTLNVIDDSTGPSIVCPTNMSMMVGDSVDLMAGVVATDDYDAAPEIYVDANLVNFSKIGAYTVAYIALDDAGNTSRKEMTLTVLPPEGADFNEYVYQMADDILASIKCSKKTKTALAIFNYVHDNMTYDSSSFGASTPEEAAFIGFTTGTGNCYIYASCCKILLDRAGISSMFITRYPIVTSGHFWLLVRLNGKWWHCDATPFMGHEGIYFMLTDDQLDQYHEFDPSKYPARSTQHSGMAVGACVGLAKDYSAVPEDPSADGAALDDAALTPSVTPGVTAAVTPGATVTPGAGVTPETTKKPVPTVTPEATTTPGDDGLEGTGDTDGITDGDENAVPPVPTVAPEPAGDPGQTETDTIVEDTAGEQDVAV